MGFLLIVSVLLTIISLYVVFASWKMQYWKRRGVPSKPGNIVFGNVMPMVLRKEAMVTYFLRVYEESKRAGHKFFGIYSAFVPELVAIDAEFVKDITVTDDTYFNAHGFFHHERDSLTMNLFNLEGEDWKNRRTKLSPMYTTYKMKMFSNIIQRKGERLVEEFAKLVNNDKPIFLKDYCRRYTIDVIGTVAFGLDIDTLHNPDHKFRHIGESFTTPKEIKFLLETLVSSRWLGRFHYRKVPIDIEKYFTKIINETIKYRETTGKNRNDILQLLMELKSQNSALPKQKKNGNLESGITEKELVSEAFVIYLAGFETSASSMTFALFELAQHQEIQNKVRKEIQDVLKKYNGQIDYESVSEMVYLDKVLKETLRKYPVLAILPRKCIKDYRIRGTDIIIERGTKVYIPIVGLQNDSAYYPNPEIFNPENFSAEAKDSRPDITWMPFGAGPRKCIGWRLGLLQTKMGLCHLINSFHFKLHHSMEGPYSPKKSSLVYSFEKDIYMIASHVKQ